MRIILASKSPRRRELLSKIVSDFEILARETDESIEDGVESSETVRRLAVRKGEAILDEVSEDSLVISSDTLVELDGIPLGKPTDEQDAVRMLTALSARVHNVHTGIAVHYMGKCYSATDTTRVTFRNLTQREIADYVATGEPMDKAGAYGIQGIGGTLVEKYDGNYDTVVGLSLSLLVKLMNDAVGEQRYTL